MPFDGLALDLGSGQVLLGPEAVPVVAASLRLAQRVAARDGIPGNANVAALLGVLSASVSEVAHAHGGSPEVPNGPDSSPSISEAEMTAREVAAVLGTTDRNVRDLAGRRAIPARRRGRRWVFDAAEVALYVAQRKAS